MKKVVTFVKESQEELKKVSWPSRDDITRYTVVTVVTLFVFSVFLWVVDSALLKLIKLVMK